MSSSNKGQTTTSSMELPGWMQPYATGYLNRAQTVADKPYQAYGGQTIAGMDPRTSQGLDMQAQLGTSGTAAGNAGQSLLTDTLSGKYMGSNPYLNEQIDAAQGDLIRNYNTVAKPQTESAMVGSGSFGHSGLGEMQRLQQSDLQRNLGRVGSDMRMGAYNTERGNMQQALGMVPQYNAMQFGNAQALQDAGRGAQAQEQLQLSDAYQQWQQAQGYDAQQLGLIGNAFGTVRGNSGTQTTTGPGSGPSTAQTVGQTALAAYLSYLAYAGSAASDRRVKTDIKKVGEMDDGLGIYTYKYKWGGPTQMGVLAQEVEKKHPEAVVTAPNGLKGVKYGLLGA
jgi:hypothetical protein